MRAEMVPLSAGVAPAIAVACNTAPGGFERTVSTYLRRAQGAYAERTLQGLASDWRGFALWCRKRRRTPLPAEPETVAAYLGHLAESRSLATLKRHLATIAHLHRACRHPSPGSDPEVRLALRAFSRALGARPRHRRAALRAPEVAAILEQLGGSLTDCRDRALLLTARDTLGRRSDLAAMLIEDITWRAARGGATLLIRRAKNDSAAAGRRAWLAPETRRALALWLRRAEIRSGPLFRQVIAGRQIGAPLQPRGIARRIKAAARRAGLEASRVSGHSTRIGMTVDLVADGQSLVAIQIAGGWCSPVMPALYARDLLPEQGAVARYHRRRHR